MLDTEVYVVVHENDGAALVGDSCTLHTKRFLYKYFNKSAPCGNGLGAQPTVMPAAGSNAPSSPCLHSVA